MKRIILLIAVAFMFLLTGCGTTQEAAPAPTDATAEITAGSGDIGIDKAIEIALQDAGMDKSNATITKQASEIDDGISVYEVSFVSGDMEYDYDIEAATGAIREKSSESIYDD